MWHSPCFLVGMKYLSFVALISAAYFIYAPTEKKTAPVTTVSAAASPSPAAASTDYLKRPLDRTHEVLGQIKVKTAQEGGF